MTDGPTPVEVSKSAGTAIVKVLNIKKIVLLHMLAHIVLGRNIAVLHIVYHLKSSMCKQSRVCTKSMMLPIVNRTCVAKRKHATHAHTHTRTDTKNLSIKHKEESQLRQELLLAKEFPRWNLHQLLGFSIYNFFQQPVVVLSGLASSCTDSRQKCKER